MEVNNSSEIDSILETINNSGDRLSQSRDKEREEYLNKQKIKHKDFIERIPKIIDALNEKPRIESKFRQVKDEIDKIENDKVHNVLFVSWFFIAAFVVYKVYHITAFNNLIQKSALFMKIILMGVLIISSVFLGCFIMIKLLAVVEKLFMYPRKRKRILDKYNITQEQYDTVDNRIRLLSGIIAGAPSWIKQPYSDDVDPDLVPKLYERFGYDIDGWKEHIKEEKKRYEEYKSVASDGDEARWEQEKIEKMEEKRLKMEEERLKLERESAKDVEKIKNYIRDGY
jgi:hypothetical protein